MLHCLCRTTLVLLIDKVKGSPEFFQNIFSCHLALANQVRPSKKASQTKTKDNPATKHDKSPALNQEFPVFYDKKWPSPLFFHFEMDRFPPLFGISLSCRGCCRQAARDFVDNVKFHIDVVKGWGVVEIPRASTSFNCSQRPYRFPAGNGCLRRKTIHPATPFPGRLVPAE